MCLIRAWHPKMVSSTQKNNPLTKQSTLVDPGFSEEHGVPAAFKSKTQNYVL